MATTAIVIVLTLAVIMGGICLLPAELAPDPDFQPRSYRPIDEDDEEAALDWYYVEDEAAEESW